MNKSTPAQAGSASGRLLNSPLSHLIERVTIYGGPGSTVTLSGADGIICSVTCSDFTTAVNAALDIAEGKRAPELLAENERLRADLARVSAEFGLPPGIGPAPGEIARIISWLRVRVAELEQLATDAYLQHQLGGGFP